MVSLLTKRMVSTACLSIMLISISYGQQVSSENKTTITTTPASATSTTTTSTNNSSVTSGAAPAVTLTNNVAHSSIPSNPIIVSTTNQNTSATSVAKTIATTSNNNTTTDKNVVITSTPEVKVLESAASTQIANNTLKNNDTTNNKGTATSTVTVKTNDFTYCLSKYGGKGTSRRHICATDGNAYRNLLIAICVNNNNVKVFTCSRIRSVKYCSDTCKAKAIKHCQVKLGTKATNTKVCTSDGYVYSSMEHAKCATSASTQRFLCKSNDKYCEKRCKNAAKRDNGACPRSTTSATFICGKDGNYYADEKQAKCVGASVNKSITCPVNTSKADCQVKCMGTAATIASA